LQPALGVLELSPQLALPAAQAAQLHPDLLELLVDLGKLARNSLDLR
jgi:hypothetical protein